MNQLRHAFDQAAYLPRALRLVTAASPRWTIVWAIVLAIQGVAPVAIVFLSRLLVDSLVGTMGQGASWSAVAPTVFLAVVMGSLLLIAQLLGVVNNWVRTAQAEIIEDYVKAQLHHRSFSVDLAHYETPEYHDQMARAQSGTSRRLLALLESGGSLVQNTITLLGMLALVTRYGAWVPAVLIASTSPALYVVFRYKKMYHEWWKRRTQDRRWSDYYNWMLTYSPYAAEIRIFDLGPQFKDAYQTVRAKLRGEQLALLRRESVAALAASLGSLLVTAAIMAWMVWRAFLGQVTLGDLVLFYQAFDRGQNLMRSLLGHVGQIYANSLFLENLYEFLDLEAQVVDPPDPRPVPSRIRDGVRFDGITFRYPGSERPALRDFDLFVPSGQVAAIVGPNGAGKTTVVKLLCRFYDPESGRVELDGSDLRSFRVSELRRLITVLFQDPVQYHATVARNIAFGDLKASPSCQDIEEAARGAGADHIVQTLPDGYDTMLGKWFTKGTQLSAGEWQRVALARAFFRKAQILILDEPTSFMDPWAEAAWLERFRQLARDRTAIIVTHRFSLASRADIVHVMEEGRIVESGTPAELADRGGLFARFWAAGLQADSSPGSSTRR